MPTAVDYDQCTYLPSARIIQKSHGGIVQLRSTLNLAGPANYTTGATRSKVATEMFANARIYEEKFYSYLTSIIPQIRVHEQKRLRPGNIASDFYVYTSETTGFAIDLFYAESIESVNKIMNIKRKRYDHLSSIQIYFVVMNKNITQSILDSRMNNKKYLLLEHTHVYSEKAFKELLPSLL